jgi:hypothetical protein
VDARNRKGTKFVCRCCGHTTHADVNAARNHARRAGEAAGRSGGEAVGRRSRVKVLQELVERFATAKRMADLQRQVAADPGLLEPKRRHSSPGLVSMLSNPYFRAVVAPLRAQASSS